MRMNVIHVNEPGMSHYLEDELHHHMSGGNVNDVDDENISIGGRGTVDDAMDGDAVGELGNPSDTQGSLVPHVGGGDASNQLTLTFQGQVYVFDSVSPEKVQAVLLLLGGREVPPSIPAAPMSSLNRALSNRPQKINVPQRLASLIRFREKRKERNFDKKIRYTVRKEVALRMQRNKGQFTSSKPNQDEAASVDSSWESTQSWGTNLNRSQLQDAFCRHCGTSEKFTPMMRRGPEGPRTLCNACGLMWANKGTLRDLSKTHLGTSSMHAKTEEDGKFEGEDMAMDEAEVEAEAAAAAVHPDE